MAYIGLGSRQLTAELDDSGLNAGNWTNHFTAAVLNVHVAYYEVYTMSVTGITVVSSVIVYVNGQVRSSAKLFGNAEWDPAQPILMSTTDELALAWDQSATGVAGPPSVTIWMRYDPALQPGVG